VTGSLYLRCISPNLAVSPLHLTGVPATVTGSAYMPPAVYMPAELHPLGARSSAGGNIGRGASGVTRSSRQRSRCCGARASRQYWRRSPALSDQKRSESLVRVRVRARARARARDRVRVKARARVRVRFRSAQSP